MGNLKTEKIIKRQATLYFTEEENSRLDGYINHNRCSFASIAERGVIALVNNSQGELVHIQTSAPTMPLPFEGDIFAE